MPLKQEAFHYISLGLTICLNEITLVPSEGRGNMVGVFKAGYQRIVGGREGRETGRFQRSWVPEGKWHCECLKFTQSLMVSSRMHRR